jgi:enoyl-CoA hydratase
MSDYQTITVSEAEGVCTITLNRPDKLNALNQAMLAELSAAFDALVGGASRVLIITGAGAKAFAAGADISEFGAIDSAAGSQFAARGQAIFSKLAALDQVVIAAVNGFALGGGCELALACDIRIAADSAMLGQPEINLGIIPGYGGSQRLTRLVGPGRAMLLLTTGDRIGAAEAYALGLVDQVVPAANLITEVSALAARLAQQAPIAIAQIKRAVADGLGQPLDRALAIEAEAFGRAADSADRREGAAAFLAKRQPMWQGK